MASNEIPYRKETVMNFIAIVPEHLWLIQAVNQGELPPVSDTETTFLLIDPDHGNLILTATEALEMFPASEEYITRFTR